MKRIPRTAEERFARFGFSDGIPVAAWLERRREVSDGAKIVHGVLLYYADRDDVTDVTAADLAPEVGKSETDVRRAMDELRQHGLISTRVRIESDGHAEHAIRKGHPWQLEHIGRALGLT